MFTVVFNFFRPIMGIALDAFLKCFKLIPVPKVAVNEYGDHFPQEYNIGFSIN